MVATLQKPGIDGTVELLAELDRASASSQVAANAPRGRGLAAYLASGINEEFALSKSFGPFWDLTTSLIQKLSIWWPASALSVMPVMTPWCIRDRSARYDQGPESWGAPRADGYFRDDNSIIKKLPLPLTVTAPSGSPYAGRRPWRGFTACHIWRELEDGSIGGTDQWIYSNMMNLVWLPSPLMSLTDHNSRVKSLLKQTSSLIFSASESTTVDRYLEHARARLFAPKLGALQNLGLDLRNLASFDVTADFFRRRLNSIDLFVDGASDLLDSKPLSKKIICTRYTSRMPLLEKDALEKFRSELADYAFAVRASL